MGWIAAAASVAGDVMSQQGQSATNAMNQSNMMQQEQWQTDMSNTAMQRRVADLKAAGLNPLLATGTSGAQVGSTPLANLQNPNQAFGQLGSQVTNAAQNQNLQSQRDLMDAQVRQANTQAEKNVYETENVLPANVQKIQADTGVSVNVAQQVQANIKYLAAQIQNVDADTAIKDFQKLISQSNAQVAQASVQALINMNLDSSKMADYGLNLGRTESSYFGSQLGKAAWMATQAFHPITSAVGVYGALDPQSGGSGAMSDQQQNNYLGR